jgi:hypothetical protein
MRVSGKKDSVGASLFSPEHGELLVVRYAVEPRLLEEALEALAHAPFPINPELRHPAGNGETAASWRTVIEFPAYAGQLDALRRTLQAYGLDGRAFTASPLLPGLIPA